MEVSLEKSRASSAVVNIWTDARRLVPRLWIGSAEVRGGGGVVRRMGTQQQCGQHIQPEEGCAPSC